MTNKALGPNFYRKPRPLSPTSPARMTMTTSLICVATCKRYKLYWWPECSSSPSRPSLRPSLTVSMPPSPNTAPQTDPNLAEGPRKRRPTERVIENGDPLVRKRARVATASENKKVSTKVKTVSQQVAISKDVPVRAPHAHLGPSTLIEFLRLLMLVTTNPKLKPMTVLMWTMNLKKETSPSSVCVAFTFREPASVLIRK